MLSSPLGKSKKTTTTTKTIPTYCNLYGNNINIEKGKKGASIYSCNNVNS